MPPEEQCAYLCGIGHLAPSTHNSQPWRFRVEPGRTIAVLLDRAAVLPASDPTGREAVVSVGCATENMVTAAHYLGFRATVTRKAAGTATPASEDAKDRYVLLARISLAPARITADRKLFLALFTRRVLRAEPNPAKPIPQATLAELRRTIKGPTIRCALLTEPSQRLRVAELQSQAESFVMNRRDFTKELGAILVPDRDAGGKAMPGSTFGLSQRQSRRLHRGLSGKIALRPNDGLTFALGTKMMFEKSPLIGMLAVTQDGPASWFEAGRAGERIMLALERKKVPASIHAGIVEVPLIARMCATTFGLQGVPVFLFRAGYAKRKEDLGRPYTPRRPLAEVLLPPETTQRKSRLSKTARGG